jgi:hypothetical protein
MIDYNLLLQYVEDGKTIYELCNIFNENYYQVYKTLKYYNIQTKNVKRLESINKLKLG